MRSGVFYPIVLVPIFIGGVVSLPSNQMSNGFQLDANANYLPRKRSLQDLNCIQACRGEYKIKLINQNLRIQNQGAADFILCLPACFFPNNNKGNYVGRENCKKNCNNSFDRCYYYATYVETFSCVLEKDKCENDCSLT